ncbi:hypothetical protein [Archaeoglobus sulfaticallidus]|uniref:hypothetical protein n=1 Tax=Archaeoglobus sulfaticallidus TaxID=1316941 RepID=UPI00064F76D3|nr:hypothetical protein [Archaeoglobus sulfaticallidus]
MTNRDNFQDGQDNQLAEEKGVGEEHIFESARTFFWQFINLSAAQLLEALVKARPFTCETEESSVFVLRNVG